MERSASVLAGVWFAGARVIVRVRASQSDGRLGAWESQEPFHTALPLHVHTREDEQVTLLEGTLSFLWAIWFITSLRVTHSRFRAACPMRTSSRRRTHGY